MPKVNLYRSMYEHMVLAPYRHRLPVRESLSVSVVPATIDEEQIETALYRFDGNVSATADYLQVSERKLRRIIDGSPKLQEAKGKAKRTGTIYNCDQLRYLGETIYQCTKAHQRRRAGDDEKMSYQELRSIMVSSNCDFEIWQTMNRLYPNSSDN